MKWSLIDRVNFLLSFRARNEAIRLLVGGLSSIALDVLMFPWTSLSMALY